MPDKDADISPFSTTKINRTKPGYSEIKEGFSPTLPSVGTITHDFLFTSDPWQLVSNEGAILAELGKIRLSVSKVFNINNTTDCFYALSWNPNYHYRARYFSSEPIVSVFLFDASSALLDTAALGALEATCGLVDRQSKKRIINPLYFDRLQAAAFSIGAATWYPC